ncbi:MAG: glutamate synthase subunit beta [bacterium]|nr:glutamate synthase subunit beta [bacterium]MDE0376452.1 glutamate synthase subunit beta [bacterium]
MGDVRGFLTHGRRMPVRRPVGLRVLDWNEVYEDFPVTQVRDQASRCMDCGIPFCSGGCPLGNLIPDWNDLVYRDDWRQAIDRLHATNNFPEFTGRLCPAPCEAACVLGINSDPVTIEQIELEIVEKAWAEGWVTPVMPTTVTGHSVAVVGSGPAGLAAAQQLTRAGHAVTVFERDDRIGGLLRYGIPDFKMEKQFLDRRVAQMEAEGTRFRVNADVGADPPADRLRDEFDAVILAGGATLARDLPIAGRDLEGIHQAMEYLTPSNRIQAGDLSATPISARDKRVIIIGGGDTGADCLGTAHRQGAASVHQFEIMPRPPDQRADATPWPTWPLMYRVSAAHEEGGQREFAINTEEFVGDPAGHVTALRTHRVDMRSVDGRLSFEQVDDSAEEYRADLVLLALGFAGPDRSPMLEQLGVEMTDRGNVARDHRWATNVEGVFVAGDMGRGQSLIVWAIAEGRSCAAAVDHFLMGETMLPEPVTPTDTPWR